MTAPPPSEIGSLLIRTPNWLGDAVMSTPALMRLRQRFPEGSITLVTPSKLAGLWRHHPAADCIVTFDPGESLFRVARKMRARRPTHALIFPNSIRSALECFWARIPARVGLAADARRLFLTAALPPPTRMKKKSEREIRRQIAKPSGARPFSAADHHSLVYLKIAAALGANPAPLPPQLFVAPDEQRNAAEKFGLTLGAVPYFGLNPGAEYGPAKRWPPENFIAAARAIARRRPCVWILFGGAADQSLARQIVAALTPDLRGRILDLSGKTSLRELCALIKSLAVFLTNDTGPMHVAAALQVPVVALYGSTAPELTGPGLPGQNTHALIRSNAPCAPCFRRQCPIDFRCMRSISAESAAEAVLRLASTRAAPPLDR